MKTLSKRQQAKIKSLSKKGKTQGQIARALVIKKQVISTYMQKAGIGKRAPKKGGAVEYWKDVDTVKETLGISRKEASKIVFKSSKWEKRRFNRLPRLRKLAAEKWKELGMKARAERFRRFKRGDFKENTGVSIEDYEDYFTSE